jgi:pectin methylesterase-like acyl-CoA thioesterase
MPERSNRHRRRRKPRGGLRGRASLLPALLLFLASLSAPAGAAATRPRVLRVGTWHGIPGPYHTIQAAVDHARPGDWVLVGPGLYHERGAPNAGVLITTPGVRLRGMDRNRVIVDGTRRSAAGPCAPQSSLQDFGPRGPGGEPEGRNGVEVYRTSGVTVENLTACNFLSSPDGEKARAET